MDYLSQKTELSISRRRQLIRWLQQPRTDEVQHRSNEHPTLQTSIINQNAAANHLRNPHVLVNCLPSPTNPHLHQTVQLMRGNLEKKISTHTHTHTHTLLPSGSGQTCSTWFRNVCRVNLSVSAGTASHGWFHVAWRTVPKICHSVTASCVWKTQALPFIHSFIQSALRQVHSLFQIELSTECDLVLPLSIYSIPSLC